MSLSSRPLIQKTICNTTQELSLDRAHEPDLVKTYLYLEFSEKSHQALASTSRRTRSEQRASHLNLPSKCKGGAASYTLSVTSFSSSTKDLLFPT
ncbi:hypothetical protein F2Q69_00036149 [Brassica cretica]|uniref:Uncharacterized protein n=2 Tax=Brassica cretica TaxID=69181 RepID=A0A8S9SCZ6_BRACR|nr:hypothetical protein DY000_02040679 [Brassica cretica]KAF3598599.1 hypothetical protein F2Q69_00036149 [Brassica cretica]